LTERRGGRAGAVLKRPAVQTFLATVAITGVNLVTGAILARQLGPSGRGALAAALLWPQLLRFAIMVGATDAITYWAARPEAQLRKLAGTATGLAVVQAVAVLGVGSIVIPLILSRYAHGAVLAGFISLGTVCIGTAGMYYLGILNGQHRWTTYNVLSFLISGLAGFTIVLLALLDELTVTTTMLCYLAGVAPTTIVGAIAVRRVAGPFERPDRELARSLLGYGVRTQFSMVRNPLSQQIDQLVVSLFLAPAQLGLYVVAYTMTVVVGFVSAAFSVVALPAVARAEDPVLQRALASRYMSRSLLSGLAVAIPLEIFAGPLMRLVFGDEFGPSAAAARILLAAAVLTACARVAISVLNGLGRPSDSGVAGALMIGGAAAGLAVFVPLFGLEGAALGAVAGALAGFGWSLNRVAAALSVRPWSLLVPHRALAG
jgi:O-antigen/teichoic acid export membrane protein